MLDKLKIRVQLAHKFNSAHRPLHTKVIKRFLILPVGSSFQNQDLVIQYLAKPSTMKSQPYLLVLRRPRHDPEYMAFSDIHNPVQSLLNDRPMHIHMIIPLIMRVGGMVVWSVLVLLRLPIRLLSCITTSPFKSWIQPKASTS